MQTSGIQYGVSPKQSKFALYVLTDKRYKKVQNIQQHPKIGFVIPCPHYYLRFIQPATLSFQGTAEILPFEDSEARESLSNRAQKRMIRYTEKSAYKETAVFLN